MNLAIIPQEKLDLLESKIDKINAKLDTIQVKESSPNWIPKKEACKELKVCSKTFDNYLKRGILPYTQFKGKVYIKASDIQAHLEKYYITK